MIFMPTHKTKHAPYDAWLQVNLSDICNLDCTYCISESWEGYQKKSGKSAVIDIPRLLNVLKATQKTFKIVFTGGGEPFIISNIIEACQEISKEHYLSFTTNLTSPKIKLFSEKIDPRRVLWIVASLHLKELERTHLLSCYIDNFLLLQSKGFNIEAKAVADPSLLNDMAHYLDVFKKRGIKVKFAPFIGPAQGKTYPHDYTHAENRAFDFNRDGFKMFTPKGKLCNAGFNVASVLPNGDVHVCMAIPKKIGNIYEGIEFNKTVNICSLKEYPCPYYAYDHDLLKKALREDKTVKRKIIPYLNAIFTPVLIDFKYKILKKFKNYKN